MQFIQNYKNNLILYTFTKMDHEVCKRPVNRTNEDKVSRFKH